MARNQELEKAVLEAVTETTLWLRNRPRGYGELEWKGYNNPVTSYDKRAERRIRKKLVPFGVDVIGEEYGISDTGALYSGYVDPIDGTKSFLRGHPGCSVSLAVTDADDRFIASAVGDISTGQVYYARGNKASMVDLITGRTTPLRRKHPLPKKYLVLNEQAAGLFEALGDKDYSTQVGGLAIALNMAMTAAGIYDGIIYAPRSPGGTNTHDVAAGTHLLQTAGLVLTDIEGAPFDFRNPGNGIIALPEELYGNIQEIVDEYLLKKKAREKKPVNKEKKLKETPALESYGGPARLELGEYLLR